MDFRFFNATVMILRQIIHITKGSPIVCKCNECSNLYNKKIEGTYYASISLSQNKTNSICNEA